MRASVGHVADLPSKGLAVDVDNGFKPTYELTERGKQVVKDLRAALKDASELYLATDEDREGEAISWHLLEHLKPKVPVKRMVFHEITASAIDHAVNNPRGIDYGLVDAAETRRILDRLYGYEVSPVLWRRVNRGLSAGRVQSPSIRLIVERERERIAFVVGRLLGHRADDGDVAVVHRRPRRRRRHAGRHRQGLRRPRHGRATTSSSLDEARARGAGRRARPAPTSRSARVEEKPYRSRPQAPFMTSHAAAGGRPQAAPVVVAGDARRPGPVRAGLHHLHAHRQRRRCPTRRCRRCGPRSPASTARSSCRRSRKQYTSKVKNAQEAHEAIRPTTPLRSPQPGRAAS